MTNIMVISFFQTGLDNTQQDQIGKQKRKMEIIERLPFTGPCTTDFTF